MIHHWWKRANLLSSLIGMEAFVGAHHSQSQSLMLGHDLAVTGYRSTAVARGRKGCWNPKAERLRMSKCLPLPKEQTSVR